MMYPDFTRAIQELRKDILLTSRPVHTQRWQGVEVASKPEMSMMELLDVTIRVPLESEELDIYRDQIGPNLPWADNHFLERVCGRPINPGREWENWPYGKSADKFRDGTGQFNHNYMERYWPAHGVHYGPTLDRADFDSRYELTDRDFFCGLKHRYGDLNDVVNLLLREPDTRQAFMPVWFPEDTGVVHRGRVPCTLGYLFMMRGDYLHITYYLRSCDFTRHFRDDIYLTVRLLLWVLQQLRQKDPGTWNKVKPGRYTMHMANLHVFINDFYLMKQNP